MEELVMKKKLEKRKSFLDKYRVTKIPNERLKAKK